MRSSIVKIMSVLSGLFLAFILFGCNQTTDQPSASISETETEKTVTVTFYNKELEVVYATQDFEKNDLLTIGFLPETEGYRFMGWYLDESYQTPLPDSYRVDSDLTLYAKMNHLVTLNLQYDSINKTIEVAEETSFVLPDYTEKEGYKLMGYLCNGTSYSVAETIIVSAENTIFEAIFSKIVSAQFELNIGEGITPDLIETTEGAKIILPDVDVQSEFPFVGWNDGTHTFLPGASYTMPSDDVFFQAVYDIEKEIKLVVNDTIYQTYTLKNDSNYQITLPELADIYDDHNNLQSLFMGWSDGTKTYQGNDMYQVEEQSVTLTAIYQLNTFTVTFRDWDSQVIKTEEVEYGSSATAPDLALFAVDEFIGWSLSFDEVTSTINTRAQYTFTVGQSITQYKSYFTYLENDGKYYISSASNAVLPDDLLLPTSANGRLIDGVSSFLGQTISSITIPATYQELSYRAFRNCKLLQQVNFSDHAQLKLIGDEAFEVCSSLTSITIPEGVVTLGKNVFHSCPLLERVYFPSTLQEVGSHLFYHDTSLIEISVPETSPYFASIDGNLYSKDLTTIVYYAIGKPDTSYTVLPTTTKISQCAFQYAINLTELILGNQISEIGNYAFSNCINIQNTIVIPATLAYLGTSIFYEYHGPVELEEGIKTIPFEMFKYYKGTTITLPSSIETISSYAFSNALMTTILFKENAQLKTIEEYAFYQCSKLTDFDFSSLNELSSIGNYAFYQAGLTGTYTLPSSLCEIGQSAFESSKIKGIIISDQACLSTIGDSAFFQCTLLEQFHYPSASVTSTIGIYCFADTYSLNSVILPEKLTIIAPYAFGLYYNSTYQNCIESIEIPSTVEYIGNYAFAGSKNLLSITFKGNQLRTISDYAFKRCESLQTLSLPSSLTSIGTGIIQYCLSLQSLTMEENDYYEMIDGLLYEKQTQTLLTGIPDENGMITIKEGTLKIQNYAFSYNENIHTVVINDSLQTIGDYAFVECYGLTDLNIPTTSQLVSIGQYAFSDSVLNAGVIAKMNIRSLYLPETLKEIKMSAFCGNGMLTEVHIPASVETIDGYAFADCYALTSVSTADHSSLQYLGSFCFVRCNQLREVELKSENITILKSGAFSNCVALERLAIHSFNTEYGANALRYTPDHLKIYVPAESVGNYKVKNGWKDFANQIYPLEENE